MYLKSDILTTLTVRHDTYISKFANFCMVNNHNNDDNTRIKPITLPLAYVCGIMRETIQTMNNSVLINHSLC